MHRNQLFFWTERSQEKRERFFWTSLGSTNCPTDTGRAAPNVKHCACIPSKPQEGSRKAPEGPRNAQEVKRRLRRFQGLGGGVRPQETTRVPQDAVVPTGHGATV